jgi:hypothetical protein
MGGIRTSSGRSPAPGTRSTAPTAPRGGRRATPSCWPLCTGPSRELGRARTPRRPPSRSCGSPRPARSVPCSSPRVRFAPRLRVFTGSLKWRVVFAGRQEREYEMTLKRTLQSICLLTVHPNTTTSVVLQVMFAWLAAAMLLLICFCCSIYSSTIAVGCVWCNVARCIIY